MASILAQLSIANFIAAWAVILLLSRALIRHVSIRRFKARTGSQTPPSINGGFLGIRLAKETDAALARGEYLALSRKRFEATGNTYQGAVVGQPFLATIEPENLKAIFTRIDDFTKSGRRTDWWPMLQGGILIADGMEWKKSRVSQHTPLKPYDCT